MSIQIIGKQKAKLIVSVGSGNKKRRYCKTVIFSGKKELNRLYTEFENSIRNGHRPSDMTVPELVEWHISTLETLGCKKTTLKGYRIALNRLYFDFERVLASDCTMYHIEKFITQNANKGLATKTIKNTISLLSSAYRHGIKVGIVTANPCDGVQFPKEEKKEIQTLSAEEIRTLVSALDDALIDVSVALKLALFCGLRMSEVLGLREEHINLNFGIISVKQTRHRVSGQDIIQDTKTKTSERVIALPDFLQKDIEQLIEQHADFESDYLILNEFGELMQQQRLNKELKRIEKECDLTEVTFHGLRHTHATILNAQGIDIAQISKQLGHSNISTTMNIYTHVFGGQLQSTKQIASQMDTFLENGHQTDTYANKKTAETQ